VLDECANPMLGEMEREAKAQDPRFVRVPEVVGAETRALSTVGQANIGA